MCLFSVLILFLWKDLHFRLETTYVLAQWSLCKVPIAATFIPRKGLVGVNVAQAFLAGPNQATSKPNRKWAARNVSFPDVPVASRAAGEALSSGRWSLPQSLTVTSVLYPGTGAGKF